MSTKVSPSLHIDWIDNDALKIVQTLQARGHTTYLVGGCVRDLLLGKSPKDYDIATLAKPNEVRRSIPNAYVIGKRFRLVLVKRGDNQFEVATFRKDVPDSQKEDDDIGDNYFGTPTEDANRRDFTINGLFYDPVNDKLIDFIDGREDLDSGVVRMIGEPVLRLAEDPIRILRAIRLAHMIHFKIDSELRKAIVTTSKTLEGAALPRKREEFLKFLRLPDPSQPFTTCYDLGILEVVSPMLHKLFSEPTQRNTFLTYLASTHNRHVETPTELFCSVVNAFVRARIEPDFKRELRTNELLGHPELERLMKDELGLFKYEQLAICKALQMQTLLANPKSFQKESQRKSLLHSESFLLSISLCEKDYCLDPETLAQWKLAYMELSESGEINHDRPRRRPIRRKKKKRTPRPKPSDGNE